MEKITIQKGDTLSALAKKYGTTVSALMAANPNIKDPNLIIAGASLNIPTASSSSVSQSTTPTSTQSMPTSSYTIKSGDTLSQIAQAQGTTIEEIMKLNPQITNPNLIYAGKTLTLPTSGGSAMSNYSSINPISAANDIINANQAKDAASANVGAEPATRKTVEDYMKEITEAIKPKTAAPAAPDYQATYEQYRTQYGLTDLENQLNSLKAQEADLLAIKEKRVAAEREKPVATNIIEGRVSQVEREENERLAAIQRSIANVSNQLQTKYNIVDTLMKLKQMDYESAVSAYEKEMSNNIAFFNAARSISEEEKTEIEREKDNARANAQIILNTYTAQGITYDQLPETDKVTLTKLGVQSGLGADFFANVLKISADKGDFKIIVSSDETKATLIYKDGTTKTISTGLPAKEKAGEGLTDKENLTYMKQYMAAELEKTVGSDGYVSPTDWAIARKKWTTMTPYSATDFDDAFRGYVNPQHPQDYAGFENYSAGFIKLY